MNKLYCCDNFFDSVTPTTVYMGHHIATTFNALKRRLNLNLKLYHDHMLHMQSLFIDVTGGVNTKYDATLDNKIK